MLNKAQFGEMRFQILFLINDWKKDSQNCFPLKLLQIKQMIGGESELEKG